MPLHVPPVSRREFLAGTVSAGAALLSLRGLSANEPDVDSDSWAFLSDTHIWSKRNEMVRGVKMADNLTRVGEQLRALPGRPGGVFINGDCAYLEGEAGDYDAFADLLKPLGRWGLPVHMTMGNHDNRERFWTALNEKGKSRPLEGRQISVVETPRANWFLLDSLTETNKTPGLLGQDQLDWLAKALDVYGAKPAIIFTHHHPDPGPGPDGKPVTGCLGDTEAMYEIIRPRRQVKLHVFGHTHHWEVKERDGIHLVNLPPVAYLFNPKDPNGWVHCRLREDGATLQLHALDSEHTAHGQIVDLKWRSA